MLETFELLICFLTCCFCTNIFWRSHPNQTMCTLSSFFCLYNLTFPKFPSSVHLLWARLFVPPPRSIYSTLAPGNIKCFSLRRNYLLTTWQITLFSFAKATNNDSNDDVFIPGVKSMRRKHIFMRNQFHQKQLFISV